MKIRVGRLCIFTLISLLSLFGFAAQAVAQVRHAPTTPGVNAETPRHRHALAKGLHVSPDGSVSLSNWSGYLVTGATDSVTDVKGSWTVPAVSCAPSNSTYSAFWVGIDGYPPGNNNTLEQIGTESDCQNGTPVYYAWYEFLPQEQTEQLIPNFQVAPGDLISAEVSFDSGSGLFTVTITDKEKNGNTEQYSTSETVNGAQRSTAEWIAEAPSISGSVQPLANFGKVNFVNGSATIGGKTGTIGSFGSAVDPITMTSDGKPTGTVEAVPSPLSNGNSFSVVWVGLTTLYSFCSVANCADGAYPETGAGLIQDAAGNLYGTTFQGGNFFNTRVCNTYGCGIVFKVDTTGHYTVLYSFCAVLVNGVCTDGAFPYSGPIEDTAGNLYGTTASGGSGGGTVFKLDTAGHETVLHDFCSVWVNGVCTDGNGPLGLIRDAAGNFYGVAGGGGGNANYCPYGCGTVFNLDTTGHYTVLYDFCSVFVNGACMDGAFPYSSPIEDTAGNLYGTTSGGGNSNSNCAQGCGTVFKVDNTGHETVLYSFCPGGSPCADGSNPYGGLIQDATGNLYGTTSRGGNSNSNCAQGCGTVFKVDNTGHETVLYSFCPGGSPCADGSYPYGGLIQDTAGNFYGTTSSGGANGGFGTVFKLDNTGHESVLHAFCSLVNCADGFGPLSGLIRDAAGSLYGTTYFGGANGFGTVFRLAGAVVGAGTATKTTLTSSPNPSMYGQAVTFTAVVTSKLGAPPDGETVSFVKGTTVLGTGTLSGGSASFTTSALPAGNEYIKAVYGGDIRFAASTSNMLKQVVVKYTTTTALSSSLNPSNYGQAVTFTATATTTGPYPLTSEVKFWDGTVGIGSATLNGGVATLTKSTLAVGTHPITAEYLGDAANAKSTSPVLNQVVQ